MGLKESAETINCAALKNAKAAALPGQYIVGELGPLGEMFLPMGTMAVDKAKEIYSNQARIIDDGGVDRHLYLTFYPFK